MMDKDDMAQEAALSLIESEVDPAHYRQRARYAIIDSIRMEMRRNLSGGRKKSGQAVVRLKQYWGLYDDGDGFSDVFSNLIDESVDTEQTVHVRTLMAKVNQLRHPYPLVLSMTLEGYEGNEIGKVLGVTGSRISQIRRDLIELLKDEV